MLKPDLKKAEEPEIKLPTSVGSSENHIGIEYCGMEEDYTFISDPEILNQSIVPRPVLTVASWPAYRFLTRQVRWSDIPISLRILHSLLWSTQSYQSQ